MEFNRRISDESCDVGDDLCVEGSFRDERGREGVELSREMTI